MSRDTLIARFRTIGTCPEGFSWALKGRFEDIRETWAKCPRGDWMLWFLARTDGAFTPRCRLAAVVCVDLVIPDAPARFKQPLNTSLQVARLYASGTVTDAALAQAAETASAIRDDADDIDDEVSEDLASAISICCALSPPTVEDVAEDTACAYASLRGPTAKEEILRCMADVIRHVVTPDDIEKTWK